MAMNDPKKKVISKPLPKKPASTTSDQQILDKYAAGEPDKDGKAMGILNKMVAPPKTPGVPYPEDEMALERKQLRKIQEEEDQTLFKPPAGWGNPDQMSLPKKRKK
jgi:hypothetical protein